MEAEKNVSVRKDSHDHSKHFVSKNLPFSIFGRPKPPLGQFSWPSAVFKQDMYR
jgi:hypothetical protein